MGLLAGSPIHKPGACQFDLQVRVPAEGRVAFGLELALQEVPGKRPDSQNYMTSGLFKAMGAKKPINRKHINIFLTALVGQSSQGRTPTRPRDKRDKMAILLWNSTEKGRFVPGTGPILSRGGVPFVPGTVPVCPGHRPAENVYAYWFFFFPDKSHGSHDVAGFYAFFSARKSGNFLHLLGPFPKFASQAAWYRMEKGPKSKNGKK